MWYGRRMMLLQEIKTFSLRSVHDGGNSFGPVNNFSRTDGDSLTHSTNHLSSGIESGGEGGNNSTNIYLVWTDCLPKIVSDEPLCDILFTKSTG